MRSSARSTQKKSPAARSTRSTPSRFPTPTRCAGVVDAADRRDGELSGDALVGLQAGAPSEIRRVLSGEWPVNVVNRAVKGKTRAGL